MRGISGVAASWPGGHLEHGVGAVALHHRYSGTESIVFVQQRKSRGRRQGRGDLFGPCLVSAREGFGGLAGDLSLAVREPREPRLAGSTVRRAKVVVVGPVVVQNSL
jgi:hypothetical protein